MPDHSLTARFDALGEIQQAVLFALLMSLAGRNKTALLAILKSLGLRASATRQLDNASLAGPLDELLAQDWLSLSQAGLYRLRRRHHNEALLGLWRSGALGRWKSGFQAYLDSQRRGWGSPGPESCPLELWQALLEGDVETLMRWLPTWESHNQMKQYPPLAELLLADDAGRQLLETLPAITQTALLLPLLLRQSWDMQAVAPAYQYAVGKFETTFQDMLPLQDAAGLLAIWRGELDLLGEICPEGLALTPAVILSLMQGQVDEALQAIESWISQVRAQTRKRKLELPPDLNLLYALALVAKDDIAGNKTLAQLIKHGMQHQYGEAYPLLQRLQSQSEGNGNVTLDHLPRLRGLDGLACAALRYWLDDTGARSPQWEDALRTFAAQLRRDGYELAVQEIDALMEAQFGQPRALPDWHQQRKLTPWFQLHQKQEAWQHALNALALLGKPAEKPDKPAAESRLAWLLALGRGGPTLEPREQKLSAKGQWSKGRAVALKRLREETDSFDYLLEQDKQVISHIRQDYDYYYGGAHYALDSEPALPALAGHPAVYWADAPDTRLDVAIAEVALQLKEAAGQIRLRMLPAQIRPDSALVWEKETPTRLLVYPVSDEARQIAAIVGKELCIPQQGKSQLIHAISGIAPLLPIHSDLPELAAHIDSVPADGKLYAHLLPLDEGLRLQLLVRPLPGGGWQQPGRGMENVLGEQDGRPVQAMRNLKAEKAALKTVEAACPALLLADSDGREWQLDDPQAALEMLSQLHAVDRDMLECVWPEGERMRIQGRRELDGMRFSLQSRGGWFELAGEVTLDDGAVLQLRQLLQLIRHSRGRFVKLGEGDWLALGESLRRRLEQLALLADGDGERGVRLHALTAPLLAELQTEAGAFEADQDWQQQQQRLASLRDWRPALPSTLQAELRDYQLEGYHWLSRLARWGVGACLADDMGLGKTVQTLALLLERAPSGPQLVVAPTSVAMNWLAETARFAPTLKVRAYQQTRDLSGLGPFDLVVVSYGLLQQEAEAFAAQHWRSAVLDEAQAIKNAQTKRSQAAMALNADFRLAVSGTPLENHLGELWNLFRFLNPGLLGSQDGFSQRFAAPIENGDAAARKALKALIQPFILRRNKNQVLDELPPRTEITHKVALSRDEMHLYEALRQEAVDKLAALPGEDSQPLQVLAEITRLRRFCCHPKLALKDSELPGSKLAACAEIIEELLENKHKALIFSQFVDHLAIVREYLDRRGIAYQYLDGATSAKQRKTRIDAFQAGEGDIFLISLKAGGTGLNLTAADYVIHLDPWWNPAVEDQASDRAHRMGQQRPVTVYRLVAEHTIEEQIVALHAKKRDLADSLLEGGEVSAKLDADALLALLKGDAGL
ncbi:DEAD/DEAH box helicase [Chromobacterium alticapitis]|uniref:ATP-dependent helicase n=1 Tax=Chromobacterium alticapitis TaxID=2073169 RepID=A0A2S5DJ11_9NEIS|nr:DEAD/DEAH box helicase [Chromobacterium alticapitis]POZ63034.1 ATP-dependent helicase [Chromobacterium alticapitis]